MSNTTLQIEGTDVHIEGEGPDSVVMIHGWPDTYRLWDDQVAALRPHIRCVRFTLPGFDVRQARRAHSLDELVGFFKKVVETVCPEQKVTLMLHDWGCVFGYQFAMRHPDMVSRIVGVDIGDSNSKQYLKSLSVASKLAIFIYQSWLAIAWRIGGGLGDRMTKSMARALKCTSDPSLISCGMNYPYYIQWTRTHGSYRNTLDIAPTCPMLFIYAERKPFLFHSPAWAQALASRPGNRVVAMDARHWVMRDQPLAFNAAVMDWLAGQHS
jgi:pimeloyl-ACP methyl ester carboxylesterase